jgi:hypothetical protein
VDPALLASLIAAQRRQMAIKRVEDQMHALAAKHHGEMLLQHAHAKMRNAAEKLDKEQAHAVRAAAEAQLREARVEAEGAQAESVRLHGEIAGRDATIAQMKERTQGHVKQMAAQGKQLVAVQHKKLGRRHVTLLNTNPLKDPH